MSILWFLYMTEIYRNTLYIRVKLHLLSKDSLPIFKSENLSIQICLFVTITLVNSQMFYIYCIHAF